MPNLSNGTDRSLETLLIMLTLAAIALVAGCGGSSPTPTNAPQPTSPSASNASPTQAPASSNQAPAPQACTLLTVADVEQMSGYTGGTATPSDLGSGASSCHIITGQGALTAEVDVGPGTMPLLPGEKYVDLEGGAKGKVSTQSEIDQDWMTKIDLANSSALVVLGGSAATIDPDKKIADLKKADGSKMTFGQAYEALAHAIARNAAGGAQNPAGVVQLGDPCTALTLDDLKQLLPDFDVDAADYQDTTFGSKQCIYRFRNDTLKAAGFATLAFITQPKFEADVKFRDPLSDVGDQAGTTGGMLLDFKKGATFVYMTFTLESTDPNSAEKLQPALKDGLKQLAQKAAARVK